MSRSNSVIVKSLRLGRVVRLRNRRFYPLSRVMTLDFQLQSVH